MWILLTKTRTLTWKIWAICTSLILILILLQTISQKLVGALGISWFWFFINLIPGFLFIQFSLIKNKYPEKIIPGTIHFAIWMGTLIYLLLILFTLLIEGFATAKELSLGDYRLQSFYWLLPFQLVLLVSYYFTFYKNESLFNPGIIAIQNMATSKSKKWDQKKDELKKDCYHLISKGRVEETFESIKELFKKNGRDDLLQQIIKLQSRFITNSDKRIYEQDPSEETLLEQNRITFAVMNILK